MSDEMKTSTALAHAIFDAIYDEDDLAEMKRKGVIAQELGYSLSVKAIIACELDLVDRLTQENQQLREALKDCINSLERSYDATEWPCNGNSAQEVSAAKAKQLLSQLEAKDE